MQELKFSSQEVPRDLRDILEKIDLIYFSVLKIFTCENEDLFILFLENPNNGRIHSELPEKIFMESLNENLLFCSLRHQNGWKIEDLYIDLADGEILDIDDWVMKEWEKDILGE